MVALGILAGTAYYHSYRAYEALKRITPVLASARSQLSQGLVPANNQLQVASGLASQAQQEIDAGGFPMRVTGSLPFLGRPVQAIRLVTAAANEEAQAATMVRDIVVDMLGPNAGLPNSGPPPVFTNGAIDVDLIAGLTPRLQALIGHLRTADQDIRAIRSVPFASAVQAQKDQALAESASAIKLAQRALSGIRLLPAFLGADGPRTYFLALQNNSDQRATGGALLAYAIMSIDQGRISLQGAGRILDLDSKTSGIVVPEPAGVRWYSDATHVIRRLANSANYSPDFPAVAQTWAAMVEKSSGTKVDGIIGLDPFGIAAALQSERAFRIQDYPQPISGDNIVQVTENEQYRLSKPQQDVLPGELVAGAFNAITNPGHFLSMVRNLSSALAEKRIQIWSADPAQQSYLANLGWDGAIRNAAGGDYLNLAYDKRIGNKVDYYLQQNIAYDVKIQPNGAVSSTYHVTLENQTPPGQPQTIAGLAQPYAVDLAMLNLYVPKRARFVSASPAGEFPQDLISPFRITQHVLPKGFVQHLEGDFRVFTQTVLATPGDPGDYTVKYTVPGVVQQTADGRVYRLTIQHQPLAKPAILTVRVTLPADANVTTLAPGWVLNGNVAIFRATVTRDLVTQIAF